MTHTIKMGFGLSKREKKVLDNDAAIIKDM